MERERERERERKRERDGDIALTKSIPEMSGNDSMIGGMRQWRIDGDEMIGNGLVDGIGEVEVVVLRRMREEACKRWMMWMIEE